MYLVLEKWCGALITLFHQAEVAKRMLNRLLDIFGASFYIMKVNLGVLLFGHLKTLYFTNPIAGICQF